MKFMYVFFVSCVCVLACGFIHENTRPLLIPAERMFAAQKTGAFDMRINGAPLKINSYLVPADQGDVIGHYLRRAAKERLVVIENSGAYRVAAMLLSGAGTDPGTAFDCVVAADNKNVIIAAAKNTGQGSRLVTAEGRIPAAKAPGLRAGGPRVPFFLERYLTVETAGGFADFYRVKSGFSGNSAREFTEAIKKQGWKIENKGTDYFITKKASCCLVSVSADGRAITIFG
jgi:hypothetical protein